jgi:hypothetical protein
MSTASVGMAPTRCNNIINRLAIVVLVGLSASAAYGAKPQAVRDDGPPPFEVFRETGERLSRHVGDYATPEIQWQLEPQVQDAATVFADPLLPAHMLVATGQGLIETTDYGRTWQVNAEAAAGKIGPVSCILFRLDSRDRYYVGSKTRGLWQTNDGGKTFQPLASKATGLASDSIQAVYSYPADKLYRTILVAHGEDAPGLSKSVDNGKTWSVLYPGFHVLAIAFHHNLSEVVLVAATAAHPEVHNVYYLPSLQEPWLELISDTVCTGSAEPILPRDAVFLATADKGLFKIARNGGVTKNVGTLDDHEWASLGATWGPTADSELFYAYDPKKLGMVLYTGEQLDPAPPEEDQVAAPAAAPATAARPYAVQSRGLFTGPLVLEGAHIRANANGTVFYAVVNKSLYVGRSVASPIQVREVSVDPPLRELKPEVVEGAFHGIEQALDEFSADSNVVNAARQLQPRLEEQTAALAVQRISVTATVAYREGHPPKSVSVDLSRLGFAARSPLVAAGGGRKQDSGETVYANNFSFNSLALRDMSQDWRSSWPGIMGLTVSAVADDGSLAGAVGVLDIPKRVESMPFWATDWYHVPQRESGSVKGGTFRPRGSAVQEVQRVISVLAAGPWSISISGPREPLDLSGFYGISFLIRANRELTDDIGVQLRDQPTYALPATTKPISLISGGLLRSRKISTSFQRVVVPIGQIVKDSPDFQPSLAQGLIFSGTSSAPAEIYIDQLRCYSTADAIPAEEAAP